MENRKTVQTLSNFSIIKLNRLEKFLCSPYHNTNNSISKYAKILITSLKENKNLQKESIIWKEIFGNNDYNDQKFRKLNSDLLKLIQEFIGYETLKTKNNLGLRLEFEGIIHDKTDTLYNTIRSQLQRNENYRLDRSADFYFDKFENEKLLFEMKSEFEKKNRKSNISRDLNIAHINENLDKFYLIEKLKSYATLLSWKKIAKLDIDILNIDKALSLIPSSERNKCSAIQIYELIIKILLNPSDQDSYYSLKTLINNFKDHLPKKEIKYVYDAAITYAVDRTNEGIEDFLMELFQLYQEALNTIGFLVDDLISPTSFRNIVVVALRLGKYDWAEEFIYEFSTRLELKYRENAIYFNLARVSFYRKDFQNVIEQLQQVDYEDVWYNLNSKTMLLAAYYELEEYDVLDYMSNSFKVFISREKTLSKERKKIFLTYVNILSKLSKLYKEDKSKLMSLKKEIFNTSAVASKSWLIEKMEEKLN